LAKVKKKGYSGKTVAAAAGAGYLFGRRDQPVAGKRKVKDEDEYEEEYEFEIRRDPLANLRRLTLPSRPRS